jgi:hypothetical protein
MFGRGTPAGAIDPEQPPAWDGHPYPTQEVATLRGYVH